MGSGMKQYELAEHHGVSRPTVTRWKKRGLLVWNEDDSIDVEATDVLLREHRLGKFRDLPEDRVIEKDDDEQTELGDDADPADWKHSEAQRRKEIALAQKHELDFRQRAGELMPKDEVKERVNDLLVSLRQAFVAWPGRVAAEIAADLEVEPSRVAAVLEVHVRKMLDHSAENLKF